jgi:hypothetical protein
MIDVVIPPTRWFPSAFMVGAVVKDADAPALAASRPRN